MVEHNETLCSMAVASHENRINKKRSPKSLDLEDPSKRRQPPTLPHCIAVPSAQAGLTSLFGMGRGGTPPQ